MAEVQWFRNGAGLEVAETVGSETYKRLLGDLAWSLIDGPEGKLVDRSEVAASATVEETSEVDETPFPIDEYDELNAEQVIPRLEELDEDQLDLVEAHEVAGKNRSGVKAAIEARRNELAANS